MPNVCIAYLSGWVIPVLRVGDRRASIARIEPPLRWAVPILSICSHRVTEARYASGFDRHGRRAYDVAKAKSFD
jgi:hypothetical protein